MVSIGAARRVAADCCEGPGGVRLFIWIGWKLRSRLLKAPVRESDSTRYLPSLTDEVEYMTTKKANSRVMKSA